MSLSTREQLGWWSLAFLLLIGFLYLVGSSLMPYVLGAGIAYFLDPVADRLERFGLSRVMATVVITLVAILLAAGVLLLIVPSLVRQVQSLIETAPQMLSQFQTFLSDRYPDLVKEGSALRQALSNLASTVQDQGLSMANDVLSSSLAMFDFIFLVVVAPVVAFYLLMDWDRMISTVDGWLPRQHAPVIRDLAGRIDRTLAGFVRGQLTVCAILGCFYAVALAILGLQFGLVIGLFAGLISFIPFIGSILGGVLSIGVALFQFWGDWPWIGAVAAVFVIGQAVEGNVLTPRLVGGSVGMHPVWLMFALSAFGSLFGFTGMLVAVPVSASIGVLGRFIISEYQRSRLYTGQSSPGATSDGGRDDAE